MKTFARVPEVPGKVFEIYIGDELFSMHEDFVNTWHECPEGTQQHYYFDGQNFHLNDPNAIAE